MRLDFLLLDFGPIPPADVAKVQSTSWNRMSGASTLPACLPISKDNIAKARIGRPSGSVGKACRSRPTESRQVRRDRWRKLLARRRGQSEPLYGRRRRRPAEHQAAHWLRVTGDYTRSNGPKLTCGDEPNARRSMSIGSMLLASLKQCLGD